MKHEKDRDEKEWKSCGEPAGNDTKQAWNGNENRKKMLMKYIMELFWNIFFFKICAHFLMWEIIMKCVCMEQTGMMP